MKKVILTTLISGIGEQHIEQNLVTKKFDLIEACSMCLDKDGRLVVLIVGDDGEDE